MKHHLCFDGYAEKVRRSFDQQSLMQTVRARLQSVEPGTCTIVAPILHGLRQQHGFAHAGLIFALGDSAAGYAALSLMAEEAEVLTVEMKINLLAPAEGELLVAKGRVIKSGRRLIIVSAEVFTRDNGKDVPVALLQGTMIPTC
ncbi:MAG: PaaI family thioesterase [Paracoccaceae bacterium]